MCTSAQTQAGGGSLLTRKLDILFYGDRTWSVHLAEGLNARFSQDVHCRSLGAYTTQEKPARLLRDLASCSLICRVGHPPDMSRKKDRLWDVLANHVPGRQSFIYWIGTDVLRITERVRNGVATEASLRALQRCRNLCGSQPLCDELAELGVDAVVVPFPPPQIDIPPTTPPLPQTVRAMTYIPEARFTFYGGPQILEAARHLPSVEFLIMGSSGRALDEVPDNVRFLGRVDDVPRLLRDTTVVIRTTEHDSIGATIMEALLFGRHVITTNVVPHTAHVPFADTLALVDALKRIETRYGAGDLAPNSAGRDYALVEFDTDERFANLYRVLSKAESATTR